MGNVRKGTNQANEQRRIAKRQATKVLRSTMVFDPDLTPVLQSSTNEDLAPLVDYILSAKTNALERNARFVALRPDHRRYVDLIVQEIQTFGGNSFANVGRGGRGVCYAEIVRDVAKRVRVQYREGQALAEIEQAISFRMFDDMVAKMSSAERERLADEFRAAGWKNADFSAGTPISILAVQAGINVTGFLVYKILVIVTNRIAWIVLRHGLSLAVNALSTKMLWYFSSAPATLASGLWTAYDLAGPAYRVTVPCVLYIACLRAKLAYGLTSGANEPTPETNGRRVACEYCGHADRPIEYRAGRPVCGECGAPLPPVP